MKFRFFCMASAVLMTIGASPIASAHPAGSAWRYIGSYTNTVTSSESGDCDGFTVQLWENTPKRDNSSLIGTFNLADGPCDTPVRPIFDATYNHRTGKLSFSTFINPENPAATLRFQGKLSADTLSGVVQSVQDGGAGFNMPVQLDRKK